MDGYQLLANAIVKKAADDYRRSLKALKKGKNNIAAERMKNDCERFFRSQWIGVLTNIEGTWLMDKLREEAGYYDC
ncbi:MAG: hypothetical protein LUE24_11780 [Lachnospiraceae bacterium]|nr:hypothetical protein [Lachnospiraceae bacterium]